jgi:YHS domain-containing protein
MRELTPCQAKNARSRSTPSASFQHQLPRENLLPVKPRMPGADQDHELQSSSSHHERTYFLSSQECQKQIKTMSFIPAPATMRELTSCQAKMPGADQDNQLQSSSSHHESTYFLSSQECQEQIKTMSFIPAPATMRELTHCQAKNARSISFNPAPVIMRELASCEAKNARSRSRPSASIQLQPP